MGSRYHVVLVPYPAQSHVAPLMQLARLLHGRGADVTFVHTQSNYRRLLDAKGEAAVRPSSPGFRVEVIDDGLSLSVQQHDVAGVVDALRRNCRGPFRALLGKLPGVTCVVADTVMTFAATAAREAGVADVGFFTASACGLMGYFQYGELMKRGLVPLPLPLQAAGDGDAGDDAMATPLQWVPGMSHMRLKDMPSFCHTTEPEDPMVAATLEQMQTALHSKAIVLNTLYELEKDVVDALAAFFPPLYTVGPLAEVVAAGGLGGMDISIWQEDAACLAWLDKHKASSVVYVNFGSIHVMAAAQLREFALALASCGFPFLWIKRPDVVVDVADEAVQLPVEFEAAVARGAGLVAPWCAQPAVLKHPAVGLFVTHCGWNSLLEAAAAGQPVLCWPLFAEQSTNCRQVCQCWGNGAELPKEKEHGAVAALVREMMEGELGREKRAKAAGWKAVAQTATGEGGSSRRSLHRLLEHVLLPPPPPPAHGHGEGHQPPPIGPTTPDPRPADNKINLIP